MRIQWHLFALVIFIVFLNGCGTSHYAYLSAINHELEDHTVTIELSNGKIVKAQSIRLMHDSTSWIDPDTQAVQTASTADIIRLTRVRRLKGALQGFGIGALIGATIGSAALTLEASRVDDQFFGPGLWIPLGALLGGVPGGGAGALLGAVTGSQTQYYIRK